MSYWLGIDVGTTFTAAAICREEAGRHPVPEVVPLGSHSAAAVSSVVYLAPDGQVVVGEAAERRAATDADRVVREFKRRIGDEVPMVIGEVSHSAPEIAALVVRWVVDQVAEREGTAAAGITITHPASWGVYRTRLMADALHAAGLPEITFCTEPEAAAASYSIQERIATGSTIAVYDLGGGTFDAAVVRKTGTSTFAVLGVPQGIERLGGVDFDEAVFDHVVSQVAAVDELDPEAPATLAAITQLRRECTAAKEALSADTEVTISVLLPEVQSQVRLVRAEFEDLIRPQIMETVEVLHRALSSAGVSPEDLDAVLLVGGSSRVPLVAQLVSAQLGRPVAVDADPNVAIALGAALSGLPADLPHPADSDITDADVSPDLPAVVAIAAAGSGGPELAHSEAPSRPSRAPIPRDDPADVGGLPGSRRLKQFAAGGLLIVTVAGAAVLLASRNSPVAPAAGTPAAVTPASPAPAPNAGSGNDNPPIGDPAGVAHPIPPAAPNKPPGGTVKPADPAVSAPPPLPRTTSLPNHPPGPTTPAPGPTSVDPTTPPSTPPISPPTTPT
ncbi:MAG: Hsp70 family protein, partial [Pseudonocardiaceae bacterium]